MHVCMYVCVCVCVCMCVCVIELEGRLMVFMGFSHVSAIPITLLPKAFVLKIWEWRHVCMCTYIHLYIDIHILIIIDIHVHARIYIYIPRWGWMVWTMASYGSITYKSLVRYTVSKHSLILCTHSILIYLHAYTHRCYWMHGQTFRKTEASPAPFLSEEPDFWEWLVCMLYVCKSFNGVNQLLIHSFIHLLVILCTHSHTPPSLPSSHLPFVSLSLPPLTQINYYLDEYALLVCVCPVRRLANSLPFATPPPVWRYVYVFPCDMYVMYVRVMFVCTYVCMYAFMLLCGVVSNACST